jgi:hypothetical protein
MKDDPSYWRRRAEEARTEAELLEDGEAKYTLLEIAEAHYQLADIAEKRRNPN